MKKTLILMLMLCFSFASFSQINHDVWYGQFKVRSNSFLLPNLVYNLNIGNWNKEQNKWLHVSPEHDIHVPNWRLYDNDENVDTKGPYWWRCLLFGDYSHNYNLSLGYTISWRSFDIPIGARLGLNYEWRGLCVTEGTLTGEHRISGVLPSITVTWNILGLDFERKENWNIVAEIGTSYSHILTYNDPVKLGKDIVNNGWRGSISIGITNFFEKYFFSLNRMLLAIRYEWDTYNYFNIPGTRTRLNNLVLSVSSYF